MGTEVLEVVRERVSITLPKDVLEFLDRQVTARIYHNRSHAIEAIILKEMKQEKAKQA